MSQITDTVVKAVVEQGDETDLRDDFHKAHLSPSAEFGR